MADTTPSDDAEQPLPESRLSTLFDPERLQELLGEGDSDAARVAWLQARVDQLVRSFRVRGHLAAALDPLGRTRPAQPELEPAFFELSEADLDTRLPDVRGALALGLEGEHPTLRQLLEHLRDTYCRTIGVQYQHMDDLVTKRWLSERMERSANRLTLPRDEQLAILSWLTDAVVLEQFIQSNWRGSKSFSLEGGESLIPLLALSISKAAELGTESVTMGMAHRGRLSVMANILGKPPAEIFHDFDDEDPELSLGRGDVKYHLGVHGRWRTSADRDVGLSLLFNPSHLAWVTPVVLGRVRAQQDRLGDVERKKHLALVIHGDAAFAGQGVIAESLNLSELPSYRVGGCVHVVLNNQIGFTTDPSQARSCTYATDVARMLEVPIFHVNGEDPEAVAQVVELAFDTRARTGRDVIIDLYCFRRRGHNEYDEPSHTQPLMVQAIEERRPVREVYLERLIALGQVTEDDAQRIYEASKARLEGELERARSEEFKHERRVARIERTLKRGTASVKQTFRWTGFHGGPASQADDVETTLPRERLTSLFTTLARIPEDFEPTRKVQRRQMRLGQISEGKKPLDWAACELAALGSLVTEGIPIRFTGQDSERGTFSHRHAVLHDVRDDRRHVPLAHLDEKQAAFEVANSPLSEGAVLGFEYGYSLGRPEGLTIWEAQFGDFVNCAQVIIDQFLVSAEDKWQRLSGLVLLLPHGLDGQGPEHSSARIERWLSLASHDNLQIVQPSTPAQYFHVLRRQALRSWRKPLVLLTPKKLLYAPNFVSALGDLEATGFQSVIGDDEVAPAGVRRVLLCAGQLWYDLVKRRRELGADDVAIVRLEELYPTPDLALLAALEPFPPSAELVWVQEEPSNMGAWPFLRLKYGDTLCGRPLSAASRPHSPTPATGSARSHALELEALLEEAFR